MTKTNFTARIGGQWKPVSSLAVFSEIAGLATGHHLRPADVALVKDRSAMLIQSGAMLSF